MIKTYTTEQAEEWDQIVKQFSDYDVYYLSGYVKAFERNGDGKAALVYYLSKDKFTRGINVVMKRDIHDFGPLSDAVVPGEWFDIASPYGYGGWLIEGEGTDGLAYEYGQWARSSHIVSEFVRFHPMLKNYRNAIMDTVHLGETVYMETDSEEKIWENFSSQNRNKIRKAVNAGQKVYWCRDPRIIGTFMEVYNGTMDKDHADTYYYFKKELYHSIIEDLKGNAIWMYSMKGDIVTAIAIFLFANGQAHYHLSGSRQEYLNIAPMNLLLYEAACWACRNGYKTLHMGGGVGAGHDSLYKFKKSFHRGKDAEFWIGKKIYNEEMYQKLVEMRKRDIGFNGNTGFFPAYRGVIFLPFLHTLWHMRSPIHRLCPVRHRRAA